MDQREGVGGQEGEEGREISFRSKKKKISKKESKHPRNES